MKKYFIVLSLLILTAFSSGCMKDENNIISSFYMYPSPYSALSASDATFKVVLSKTLNGASLTITVTDFNGSQVWSNSSTIASNPITISWGGENNSGITIAPGIYLAKASVNGSSSGEKEIKILIQ